MDKPSSSRKIRAKAATPAPPETPPADEPLAFDDDGLKRVQDIIRNARATWFALLGALVFASITLASVKDVAFFVSSVETKLPLVGISVPIVSFFWAGSLLIAAIYAYFHLYLELLWQALGDAPARINGKPLADRIDPWIVADTALRLRDRLRGAHGEARASRKRLMQTVSDVVSFALVWLFGLIVIGWFWWRSMPKHEPLFTGFIGLVFCFALWVFLSGIWSAWSNLSDREPRWRWQPVFLVVLLAIICATMSRTGRDSKDEKWRNAFVLWRICQSADLAAPNQTATTPISGSGKVVDSEANRDLPFYCLRNSDLSAAILHPARADLREVVFTEKPKDWQTKDIAETEFRVRWCKERVEPKCANPLARENRKFGVEEEKTFQAAWKERWDAQLAAFPKPDLRYVDLRGADLTSTSLEGANFVFARLDDASLEGANLDGAYLVLARLRNADLFNANLSGASLDGARLDGASLFGATLVRTTLVRANLEGAYLNKANLTGADLNGANLAGARLYEARLNGANLNGARLNNAILSGTPDLKLDLKSVSLRATDFLASALMDVDLSGVNVAEIKNFKSTFGDASVTLPAAAPWPCHWGRKDEGPLDIERFLGRWRRWSEKIGEPIFNSLFENYSAIPPPAGCPVPVME